MHPFADIRRELRERGLLAVQVGLEAALADIVELLTEAVFPDFVDRHGGEDHIEDHVAELVQKGPYLFDQRRALIDKQGITGPSLGSRVQPPPVRELALESYL